MSGTVMPESQVFGKRVGEHLLSNRVSPIIIKKWLLFDGAGEEKQ